MKRRTNEVNNKITAFLIYQADEVRECQRASNRTNQRTRASEYVPLVYLWPHCECVFVCVPCSSVRIVKTGAANKMTRWMMPQGEKRKESQNNSNVIKPYSSFVYAIMIHTLSKKAHHLVPYQVNSNTACVLALTLAYIFYICYMRKRVSNLAKHLSDK